jgi:hypothetical protein
VQAIRLVLLEQGAIQTAQALFLQHLANYVRANDYTIANRDAFIDYILDKCRCSESSPNDETAKKKLLGKLLAGEEE